MDEWTKPIIDVMLREIELEKALKIKKLTNQKLQYQMALKAYKDKIMNYPPTP